MALGFALVLICILYLIDKNKVWRQAGKTALVLILVCAMALCGDVGWVKYRQFTSRKEAAAREAENKAKVDSCIKCNSSSGFDTAYVETQCGEDPNFIDLSAGLVPKNKSALAGPTPKGSELIKSNIEVDIPGFGIVGFPASLSKDEIEKASQVLYDFHLNYKRAK
ncbi:MAG TPA: hypothetical protein VFA85_06885 [Terriglobales bacterium]|nr:hypothetical protein [Terriglobales bacterium]